MTVSAITEKLLAAKKAAGLSFADLEAKTGYDEVWIASVFYRQASASVEEATKMIEAIGADASLIDALTDFPVKGGLDPVIPTDPLIYRFYEIMQVYGMP
jgi:cyanate lyase